MAIKVPMFMDISRRFLPLLLTLCCALVLPAVAQAEEKQAQVKPRLFLVIQNLLKKMKFSTIDSAQPSQS